MQNPYICVRKCSWPERPGQYSKFRHEIPNNELSESGADAVDLAGGRLHQAHVIRLAGSHIIYSKNCLLGHGAFSDCYVGKHSSGHYVAIKRMRNFPSQAMDGKARCEWMAEIERIREFEITQHFGGVLAPLVAVRTDTKSYIVSPLCDGDALFASKVMALSTLVVKLLGDVVRCLERLHKNGVVHNDIKPNNILVLRQYDDLKFLLADFGLSFSLLNDPDPGGNVWYGAPEHVLGETLSTSSDIFSLGITCMALALGFSPFDRIWPAGREADVDEETRRRVYESFEAARNNEKHSDPSNATFLLQWDRISETVKPFLLDLIREMVAPAGVQCRASNQRASCQDILRCLDANRVSPDDDRVWKGQVSRFEIGRISRAKHQVDVVDQALRRRGRLSEGTKL